MNPLSKISQNSLYGLPEGAFMARIDQTDDWRDRHAPTISAFESLAIEAYGNLPEEFRALTTNLTIEIEDFPDRPEEHTSELQSLMRISNAVFCMKKQK